MSLQNKLTVTAFCLRIDTFIEPHTTEILTYFISSKLHKNKIIVAYHLLDDNTLRI